MINEKLIPLTIARKSEVDEINSKFVYLTEETVIGKWTDGKKLYRTVIKASTPSFAGGWGLIASLPANLLIKNIYGTLKDYLPIPCFVSNSYYVAMQYIDSEYHGIQMYVQGYLNTPVEITVEYTKTTD